MKLEGDVLVQIFLHRGKHGKGDHGGGGTGRLIPELTAFTWLHTAFMHPARYKNAMVIFTTAS